MNGLIILFDSNLETYTYIPMSSVKKFTLSPNLSQYLEMQRNMDMHDRRIQNVQPTLRRMRHQGHRSCTHIKKQPLAEFNRIVTIDIENKALLKKLTDITPSRIGKEKPYKLVKNNRKKLIEDHKKMIENNGLLKRIKEAKSSYLSNKYASDRKITQNYINSISKFGYRNMTPNKTLMISIPQRIDVQTPKPTETNPSPNLCPENKKSPQEPCIEETESSEQSADMIMAIETFNVCLDPEGKEPTDITYIVRGKKVSIQIDRSSGQSVYLEIPNKIFEELFGGEIERLHASIKYKADSDVFYINLEEVGAF